MGDVINFAEHALTRRRHKNRLAQAVSINRALCSGGKPASGQYMNYQSYEAMLEDVYKLVRSGEIKPKGMILIFNGETDYHYFMRGFAPTDAIDTMADVAEDLENY